MRWNRDRSWAALTLAIAFTLASGGWSILDAALMHHGPSIQIGSHFERTEQHHADACLISAGLAVQKSIAAPEPAFALRAVVEPARAQQDNAGITPSLQHSSDRSRAPPALPL